MRGRDAIGLVLLGIVLTISVGGYIFWEQSKKTQEADSIALQSESDSKSVAKKQTSPSPSPQSSQNNSNALQVKGVNDVSEPTNQQPTQAALPGPDQFDQYEQFTDGQLRLVDTVVGTGKEAASGVQVAMLYKGYLTNGQLFDQTSPDEEGIVQPFVFELGGRQVIQGWDQGIQGMKVGGKRRLVIPHELGYGPTGQGPIPPNAMLIFDVELVAVE